MGTLILLLTGLVLLAFTLACLLKNINIIDILVISMSALMTIYAGVSFVLLKINQFSVNRSLIAIIAVSFAFLILLLVVLKRKPAINYSFRASLIPSIYFMVVFCIAVVIMNNGFFGMQDSLGIAQAKALSLTSPLGVSPMEAEYTAKMSVGQLNVNIYLNDIIELYGSAGQVTAPLIALSIKILGYTRMMYVFAVMLSCGMYLIWFLLKRNGIKETITNIITIIGAFAIIVSLAIGFSHKETLFKWNVMENLNDIISEYDVIIVDDSVMNDMYIPMAGVIHAKTYPLIGDLSEEINELSILGERVYYVTKSKMDSKQILKNGMQLKEIYSTDYYVYKNFNYYTDHSNYDYDMAYSLVYMLLVISLGVIGYMIIYGCIIKGFDTVLNILLSISTYIFTYGVVSLLFSVFNIYTLAYAVVAVTMLGMTGAMILLSRGKTPVFVYDFKKHMIPMAICIVMLVAGAISVKWGYYGVDSEVGRNQIKALQHIFTWNNVNVDISYGSMMSAYLALAGKLLGYVRMMYIIPIIAVALQILICIVCEQKIRRRSVVVSCEIISAVALVLTINGWFVRNNEYSSWERINDYISSVRVDDAVALQGDLYENFRYPLQCVTGVKTCIGANDYDSAMEKIDNLGNFVYYIADEELDVNVDRVKVLVNKECYMYQCYYYNTQIGVYSVSDSVTKGFYPPEISGVTWNKDQIAYIQCNIKQDQYDTVRLYLGNLIDFNALNIDSVELEFRENNVFISRGYITRENNGTYIDFKLNNGALGNNYNTIYFRSSMMWSPVMYGLKDARLMGFPYYYVQFLNTQSK